MTGGPVVVVGSGAAGLAAALGAAGAGGDVVVLERNDTVGGTTALSGGIAWIPANAAMTRAGIEDSPAAAARYLDGIVAAGADRELLAAFVADAARVADEIERRTPLIWEALSTWPDYRAEKDGAGTGGRSLWPRPLALPAAVEGRIHPAPDQPVPDGGARNDGVVLRGPVRGRALVGALLAGADGAGVDVRTGVRVTGLVVEDGAVVGVRAGDEVVRGAVVLATGGFQHDAALAARYLASDTGSTVAPMGTPSCDGDGLRLASDVGVEVANMDDGWWMPALAVPGEELDGAAYFRPLHGERAQPGAVMVDGTGRRFVNEAQNYGDVGQAMAGTVGPCWMIFDAAYRQRYPLGPVGPNDPDPRWMHVADDLAGLARALALPAGTLEATVTTFNLGAQGGTDPEFGRGSLPYDRWIGDPAAAHPTLAPLRRGPYYAVAVHRGCMGTKGGPRTDDRGRVRAGTG
ncbi:MAG: FAD-dependent oxidoreductase, partial [Acidimicrobiales bacterium]